MPLSFKERYFRQSPKTSKVPGLASPLLSSSLSPRPPRLVLRNLPFGQSLSTVQVEHNQGWKIYKLVKHDIFHVLLRRPTWQSIGILLILWTMGIACFAGFYYLVDRQDPAVACGLGDAYDPINFAGAFSFSLETGTTVGYTLPGSSTFFENCPSLQLTIYFQMIWSMLFNAFLFAFFYSRLARCDSRAVQVVFSKKAIVSIDRSTKQVRFQVRVYDVDSRHPVVEAHARLYAVRKDRPVPRPLRILNPNDELGAMLFLSMPTVINHHIDVYSMLHPPLQPKLGDTTGNSKSIYSNRCAGLTLRQADSAVHGRQEVECPICATTFSTVQSLHRHIRFQQIAERQEGYPEEGTHLELPVVSRQSKQEQEMAVPQYSPIADLQQLRTFFEREISEVICIVEGLDPLSSGTFQSLQSYRFEDIVWEENAIFHPCVTVANNKKRGDYFRVNLSRFHQVDLLASNQELTFPFSALRSHDSWMVLEDEDNSRTMAAHDIGSEKGTRDSSGGLTPLPTTIIEIPTISESKRSMFGPSPVASLPTSLVTVEEEESRQHSLHRRTQSASALSDMVEGKEDGENCKEGASTGGSSVRKHMQTSPTWA